ncbi:putative ER chaperone/ER translocation nucleotide exchange factor [Suhomyces tanzawaensis NRRL Y-17324]|uniref:Nucleotide exchange factor SIL1 n=1 Tax=Suhomyces tanzawaensis NRRL Y-17324 TaxID=984487 RepID=A0A1E4SLE2_9ASCO|nr:putative ER chaperone/ER translocation nucleotide exchange factor [Suhomyces tanzawaensis NRRL Y-17324]ODV80308.1 putative ER chaperone/ER translocation nucleotide exchange factor [Suhomyces tanzawaensis NRRL Y-17324]
MRIGLLGSTLATAVGVLSQIVDTEKELICNNPNNPHDCYPRLFQPTHQWQVIKEGQDIPPGLHVRLNIDTLTREAKIMDPSEDNSSTNDLVISSPVQEEEQDLQQQAIDAAHHEKTQQKIQEKIKDFRSKERAKRVNREDLNNYEGAVSEVENFDGDYSRLDQALDTLEDLSHDIEFGVKLTSTTLFDNFRQIIDASNSEKLHDKIYRIMGSSLRNNPDAVTNALNNLNKDYVVDLFSKLSNSSKSDVIQKRILGIIQALAQNNHFALNYFNNESDSTNKGITFLIQDFPTLGAQSKQRLLGLFEDLQLVDLTRKANDRRSVENSQDPDYQISQYLQSTLAANKATSNDQLKIFFNLLSELHTSNKKLKPSNEYMLWLSQEVELRKENKKRQDYSEEDKQFDEQMLKARHQVFGNPNALRKAMNDEL